METCVYCRLLCVLGLGIPGSAQSQAQWAGVPLWTNSSHLVFTGTIAVDASENVLVAGNSLGSQGYTDFATIKYSNAGLPLWTNYYHGPIANDDEYVRAVAVDASGNVFVTGHSSRNGGHSDFATVKYSSEGVPLWTNRYSAGYGNDEVRDIAVDSSGNVFVTGDSDSFNRRDYSTVAYSSAGVPLWTNLYDGPGQDFDEAAALAVDGNGNVFVTGRSRGTTFGYNDYATIAYSNVGVPLWTNRYTGPGSFDDEASDIVVDGAGSVFVTGSSYATNSGLDYVTIAYSNTGVPLWTNRYNGPGNDHDYARAIAVHQGNVIVTGRSRTGTVSGFDYATVAYSSAGLPLWTRRYNGPGNSDDYAQALAVDSSGNVYATGSSYATGSDNDYATVAYSSSGGTLWTRHFTAPGKESDTAYAIAVDRNGNVFVTGKAGSASTTIKYSSALVPSLAIARTTTNTLALSWLSPSLGFVLQYGTNLSTSNWTAVDITPTDDGATKTVIVNPPADNCFYRLARP